MKQRVVWFIKRQKKYILIIRSDIYKYKIWSRNTISFK
jgi:hypothetical protein